MTLLEEVRKEIEPYKGTLVLDWDKVVLLKDVARDERDVYYVFGERSGHRESKVYWSSCVCNFIPLKGYILEKKYQDLVRMWNLNNDDENQAV